MTRKVFEECQDQYLHVVCWWICCALWILAMGQFCKCIRAYKVDSNYNTFDCVSFGAANLWSCSFV